jgi:integrase
LTVSVNATLTDSAVLSTGWNSIEWGESYEDSDLVFCKEDGSPIHPHTFSQAFERLVTRMDIPTIRLHDLRHTHASIALKAGIAVKVISERLGIPTFLVHLPDEHLAMVAPDPDSLVFTASGGSAMDWSNFRKRVWTPAVERAGLAPLRMHDLRQTAASVLIAQGCQPKFIQEHLGHSSIVVTMDRYGHL